MSDGFDPQILLMFPVLLFSLSVHEFAHAWTAKMGGDLTATEEGRTTLNPISHIDPVGTIIVPIALGLIGAPLFGWAKPVPVTESRLRNSKWLIWVSLAGPASNILIAVVVTILLKLWLVLGGQHAQMTFLTSSMNLAGNHGPAAVLLKLAEMFLLLNVILAMFNLIPIPPLDGSKLIYHFFIRRNFRLYPFWISLNRMGIFVIYFLFMLKPVQRMLLAAIEVPLNLITKLLGV